jgi:hypothetical protein
MILRPPVRGARVDCLQVQKRASAGRDAGPTLPLAKVLPFRELLVLRQRAPESRGVQESPVSVRRLIREKGTSHREGRQYPTHSR